MKKASGIIYFCVLLNGEKVFTDAKIDSFHNKNWFV